MEEDQSDVTNPGPDALRRFESLLIISQARPSEMLDTAISVEIGLGKNPPNTVQEAALELSSARSLRKPNADPHIFRELFAIKLQGLRTIDDQMWLSRYLYDVAVAIGSESLESYAWNARLAIEARAELDDMKENWCAREEHRNLCAAAFHADPGFLCAFFELSGSPAGLKNVGNTCYLSCMLQCLFSIRPIREAVLCYGDTTTWNERLYLGRCDGERRLTAYEIQHALNLVSLLKDLFHSMISHQSAQLPSVGDAITPPRELVKILTDLNGPSSSSIGLPAPPNKDGDNTLSVQHDVDECMSRCIDLLISALPPETRAPPPPLLLRPSTKVASRQAGVEPPATGISGSSGPDEDKSKQGSSDTWIHKLLFGFLERSQSCGSTLGEPAVTTEQFRNISANILYRISDINECIGNFFAPYEIRTSGGSSCTTENTESRRGSSHDSGTYSLPASSSEASACKKARGESSEADLGGKVMLTRIMEPPPILFVQIQRTQYSKETRQPYKDNSHIRLRKRISLAKYARFTDASRSESDKRSRELHATIHGAETHLQALRDMLQIPGWKPSSTPTSGEPVLQALDHAQSVVNGIQEWAKKETAGGALGKLPDPAADIAATLRQASGQLAEVASSLVDAKRNSPV
ncbi:cysteine proteinase [Martensiomyces pterosporus]|nr:cysteine proteinase [Martensiomyces pterosporus]